MHTKCHCEQSEAILQRLPRRAKALLAMTQINKTNFKQACLQQNYNLEDFKAAYS